MIIDLKTGEVYDAILWKDANCLIFDAPHGESMITADEYAQGIVFPSEAPGWTYIARYQTLTQSEPTLPRINTRRAQLKAYADSNQGVVHIHHEPERESRPVRDLIRKIGHVLTGD